MRVAVGSENPTKIQAARIAFEKVFSNEIIEVTGAKTNSGINAQPMSDKEAIQGAMNRAKKALKISNTDFGVGEEGGMQKINDEWFETGWCVVVDRTGRIGIGSSVRMQVPGKLLRHIHAGKELGEATDIAFQVVESGKKAGFFGLMTDGHVDRSAAYADGIIAALTRFLHPDLF